MYEETYFLKDPLRWGMIGGGKGSQIGYSHRNAATRDRCFTLQAGVFDSHYQKSIDFGVGTLGISEDRCYPDYQTLIIAESKREDGIEVLSVATPNYLHYEITKMALEYGLHVICEKPLTFNLDESQALVQLARDKNLLLAVMYGYSGYSMVEQARLMVNEGKIGDIRIIQMQFAHGYHTEAVEENDPGTKWRITEEMAGSSYVIGDLGTHCFQMGQYIGGLSVKRLLCMRRSFIESRAPLEDDGHVLLEYDNGAVGTLWASAVHAGASHSFKVNVIGSKGSISWWDEYPNQLEIKMAGEPPQLYQHGQAYIHEKACFNRIGGGHPEGFFESWSNLYHRFAINIMKKMDQDLVAKRLRQPIDHLPACDIWYPSSIEGCEGTKFLLSCVQSANNDSQWVDF